MNPVEATRRIYELAFAYTSSQALFAAIKLGLFDTLSRGALASDELARQLEIHPEGCRRLLVALRQLGLVERDGDAYANSAVGAYLTTDSAYPLHALSTMSGPFYYACDYLPDALREYSPRWQQALGTTAQETFAALYEDPARVRSFAKCMEANSILQGQEIARHVDFAPFSRLLDVAGGSGGISLSIGSHYPHLRGVIMDVPPVCRVAEERIVERGLAGRFTTASADLLEGPYPTGADVITLGWILHDWNDEHCRTILRHCHEALPSGGMLVVAEKVLEEDHSGPWLATAMDLYMLALCESGARERSESEYRALLAEAGFSDMQVIRLPTMRDVIVAKRS